MKKYRPRNQFPGLSEGIENLRISAKQAGQALHLMFAERESLRQEINRLRHRVVELELGQSKSEPSNG